MDLNHANVTKITLGKSLFQGKTKKKIKIASASHRGKENLIYAIKIIRINLFTLSITRLQLSTLQSLDPLTLREALVVILRS